MNDPLDSRRRLLLAAAAGSLLPALDEATAAQPPLVTPSPSVLTPAKIKVDLKIDKMQQWEAWKSLKAKLSENTGWHQGFDISLEESARSSLDEVKQSEIDSDDAKITHNPRLVEPLLGEIAALLDRCLAYRREAAELEIGGVASAVARIQSSVLSKIDKSLISVGPTRDVAALLATNYPQAAKMLADAKDPFARAHAIEIGTQAKGNDKIRSAEDSRLSLMLGRFDFLQSLNEETLGRYNVPGNAHNYAERLERVRKLFILDITSAYRRGISAADGLFHIFAYRDAKYASRGRPYLPILEDMVDPAGPGMPDAPNFLEEFVIWTRKAMRAVAKIGELEFETTRSIHLSNDILAKSPVNLSVNFPGMRYCRLRAVGASLIVDKASLTDPEKMNCSFALGMERADPDDVQADAGPKTTIVIGTVRPFAPQHAVDYVNGSGLYNVNPGGSWNFQLVGGMTSTGELALDQSWVKGVLVHFRILYCFDDRKPESK